MSILLVGHMASGKTTLASALLESGFRKESFAKGVRTVADLAYGELNKGQMYLINDIGSGHIEVSGRELMQRIGQSIKLIDSEFWLRAIERRMNATEDKASRFHKWVVDDGRFDFELEWARKKGWLIVGVNTPEPIRDQRYEIIYGRKPTLNEKNHMSEQQIPQLLLECDLVVQGNEDPYRNMKRILEYAPKA